MDSSISVQFMKTLLLAACLIGLGASFSPAAESLSQRYSPYGDLILTQMVTAPFPHPARAEGHRYQDKFFPAEKHYHDSSVALFVPKGFKAGEAIDVVVHFHGWNGRLENVLAHYKLVEQFVASGKNAILIIPQGPLEASDSFGGKLEDADGFKRFMAEAMGILKRRGLVTGDHVGSIILSGHSGGYHVMASILAQGGLTERVKEVYLFDALYGQTEKFTNWFKTTNGKLIDLYTANGGTKVETEKLVSDLKRNQVKLWSGEESEGTDLSKSRLIFIYTSLEHDDVVEKHQHFREFLKASCLGER